jgi:hypothetical protein
VIFEQGVIKVEKEREFGDLKAAIEKAFAADRIHEVFEGARQPQDSGARPGCGVRGGCDRPGGGEKAGTARSLYEALPVSDQAQVREFYLSKWKRSIRRCGRSFTSCISTTEWISGRRLISEQPARAGATKEKSKWRRKI